MTHEFLYVSFIISSVTKVENKVSFDIKYITSTKFCYKLLLWSEVIVVST